MHERKTYIFQAIVESFIELAHPVGSKYLLEEYKMEVSPATIRNDMAYLEELGLIEQPHTSAGRIPTEKGLRQFVDQLVESDLSFRVPSKLLKQLKEFEEAKKKLADQKAESRIYYAVSSLARITDNIAFATLPWKGDAYYLGLANVLKKPEFQDSVRVSTVVEILEDKDNFLKFLGGLNLADDIAVFIGRENILQEMKSCTMLATVYKLGKDHDGILGILGPTRMNYARNIAALEAVKKDL